jgi:hypothetical protein
VDRFVLLIGLFLIDFTISAFSLGQIFIVLTVNQGDNRGSIILPNCTIAKNSLLVFLCSNLSGNLLQNIFIISIDNNISTQKK